MEMPSLDRNLKVACPEFGRDYTRIDTLRHPRTCGVLKCSNCNFYTYSSAEITDRDHNLYRTSKTLVKNGKDAQQAPNTLESRKKVLIIFCSNKLRKNDYELWFLRILKNLYTCDKIEEFLRKLYSFYITILDLSFISKVLIDYKTSNSRVRTVVKLSMEIDAKILIIQ